MDKISLLDIYKAVIDENDNLFSFHQNPEVKCPVGKNIHNVLDEKLDYVKQNFDKTLDSIKLSSLTDKLDSLT